jgi:8-oxo-dGTP diphosphatase
MASEIEKTYGNRVRVRVCGLLTSDSGLLLINHQMRADKDFWSPPGGGLEFGESARSCLKREFEEETALIVEVLDFRFTTEFIRPPLHAVELFFTVRQTGGSLKRGFDPEMRATDQIIRNVEFLSWEQIGKLDLEAVHGIFRKVSDPRQIIGLKGYFEV